MKQKTGRKLLSFLLTLAMVLGLMPGMSLTAYAAEPINLSTLTDNYTANDGDVLTGTLGGNYKISIADGATVTLNDVIINGTNDTNCRWAGITCEGDATIILSGTNIVKGFYRFYPGISVPVAKTLTIKGSGSLTASPCDDRGTQNSAAGIGAFYQSSKSFACGNIVIEGGTINATGGQYGAGIGGAWYNGCGNITITGGTVTATGGGWAPGIGGGFKTGGGNITITGGTITATGGKNCPGIGANDGSSASVSNLGDITITDGVTSVTATGGNSAPYSIGASKNCSCGTITIGGTVTGNISTNPYTYPLPHTHSFTYAADGATITATCTADGCTTPATSATLTLAAPTLTIYGQTGTDISEVATLTGLSDFNTVTGLNVQTSSIVYWNAKIQEGVYKTDGDQPLTAAPTSVGYYLAKITVNNCIASVGYTIAKADPTANAPTGLTATYGQTLANVSLEGKNPEGNTPGTWAWADAATTSIGSVGVRTFKANFTPTDTTNYNSKSNVDVTVTVGKADQTAPTGLTATKASSSTAADGKISNVTDAMEYQKDGDTSWTAVGNGKTEITGLTAGTYKVRYAGTADKNASDATSVEVGTKTDQTAPTGLTATKASSSTATDGKISGVTDAMEYQIDDASAWTAVGAGKTEITGLTSGTYKVRYKETADKNASPAANVEVGTKTDQEAPTGLTATKASSSTATDGKISGVTDAMEYQIDDASAWTAVGAGKTEITGLTAGTYKVRYVGTADKNASPETTVTIGVKEDQTAPTGLTATKASSSTATDGKISNVTAAMEYQIDGATTWTAVGENQTEITGLTAGTYKVRYKETADKNASDATSVEVGTKTDQTAPTGLAATKASSSTATDGKISNVTAAMEYQIDGATTWTAVGENQTEITGLTAGTYKVRYAGTADKNASPVATVEVGTKTDQTAPTGLTATKASSSTATDGKISGVTSAMEYQIDGASAWTAVENNKTEITGLTAGTYKVRYAGTADKNASDATSVEVGVKVAPTVTAPTAKTLTYNGQKQELVNAGSTEDGTLYYAVTTENTAPTDDNLYTTSIPSKTNAGTYYVWYKVVGDETHKDSVPKCVVVTIKKAPNTPTPTEKPKPTTTPTPAAEKAPNYKIQLDGKLKATWNGSKIRVSWGKVKDADEYTVKAAYCGTKKYTTFKTGKTSLTIKKLNGKKLNLKKEVKLYVVANAKGKKLAKSIVLHVAGPKNKKYTNARNIKLSTKKVTVKAGKKAAVKAKLVLAKKGKKALPSYHAAKFRYASSDKEIATVDKKGRIKGVKAGKCDIYVYALNGFPQKVSVTVQ